MADILKPKGTYEETPKQDLAGVDALIKDNYLGEFNEAEKEIVRQNLDVPKKSDVISSEEATKLLSDLITKVFDTHIEESDPHKILDEVSNILNGFVKLDGTTAFNKPQSGVNPILSHHLTTKEFVDKVLKAHTDNTNAHNFKSNLEEILKDYIKTVDAVKPNEVYSRKDIERILTNYVTKDGKTAFTGVQKGKTPLNLTDLTTKEYVDKLYDELKSKMDIEEFKKHILSSLRNKANSKDVYLKEETLSTKQIELIIIDTVEEVSKEIIKDFLTGSEYITKSELELYLDVFSKKMSRSVAPMLMQSPVVRAAASGNLEMYIPHGPTLSDAVGFVEQGRDLPNPISYQDLFDIIFYDSRISITADPEYIEMGVESEVCVTLEVVGITEVDSVELYKDGVLYKKYDYNKDFTDGKLEECGIKVDKTTEFKMIVNYKSGDKKEATFTVIAVPAIFTGLLPKWHQGTLITYDLLNELVKDGFATKHIEPLQEGEYTFEGEFKYNGTARHPFIIYPKSGELKLFEIASPSQQFPIKEELRDLPIDLPDGQNVIFTTFIFNPAVTSLNTVLTFKIK